MSEIIDGKLVSRTVREKISCEGAEFKAETGTTPSKYIINLRMRMAIELLETSSLSIKEISAMVGYSNFNFFTRIFKSFTGKSPTQYRKGK